MTTLSWGCYEKLRPAQIEAIREKTPIAYIPWGALEWHGLHNPIGLDALKAHGLVKELATQCGGVVLPPVFIGTDTIKPFKGFPHTLDFPFELVKGLFRQYMDQLRDEKFRVIVILTGHYGGDHVRALKEAAEEFTTEYTDTQVWALPEWESMDTDKYPANHAAFVETSMMMYFNEESVDVTQCPDKEELTLDDDGIMGEDPRHSTIQAGKEMVDDFLRLAIPTINRMLSNIDQ